MILFYFFLSLGGRAKSRRSFSMICHIVVLFILIVRNDDIFVVLQICGRNGGEKYFFCL